MPLTIEPAHSGERLESAKELFREYSLTISATVCFVEFAREVAGLPGQYGPPGGHLWVAIGAGGPAACVAVRPLEDSVCEMKRLYVRDTARGSGLGRRLVNFAIDWARRTGYGEMRLDTLPTMERAIALYESLGFQRIPPYGAKPTPGAIHFSLDIP